MSILTRIKRGADGVAAGYRVLRGRDRPAAPVERPQRAAFDLVLPNPFGGDEPWCRASFAVTTTRHARGESLRLQAHLDSCLRVPQSPPPLKALPAAADERGLMARGRRVGGGLLRYGLRRLPIQRMAPLLQRRLQTWIDIRASSTPLADGVEALVPERLREMCRDLPQRVPGQPRLATWLGEVGGVRPGVAQLTTLQIDESDLPPEYRSQPFNLSASVASCVEDDSGSQHSDQ